jgi:hypothetical protein
MVSHPDSHILFQWLVQGAAYNGSLRDNDLSRVLGQMYHIALSLEHMALVKWMSRAACPRLRHHSCVKCAEIVIINNNRELALLHTNSLLTIMGRAMFMRRIPNHHPVFAVREWKPAAVVDVCLGNNPDTDLGPYWDRDAFHRDLFFDKRL